ncbi:unnamed protein product [Darwinula stevensoni]|uniref:Uncharacterized protein n=1 Tax=Darwinula stevensoni TaxID=69355 RepID=A0A7R8XBL7_9CRUS|nr:unnamed protein product [Darwinula stevensoni]CAG0892956.1 unnamed protein product [Darwinula stevensoni]
MRIAGDIVVQVFILGEDGILEVLTTAFNPVDPGDVPDVTEFAVELTGYESVLDAQLSGSKLSAQIDLSECVDPTGQLDLSSVTAGAYFQDVTVLGVGTLEERIFGSGFGVHSNPNSSVAYETFGATVDTCNNALVYPGYWRFNENGEWGNDFGDAVLECTLGGMRGK